MADLNGHAEQETADTASKAPVAMLNLKDLAASDLPLSPARARRAFMRFRGPQAL
jgi:hypothetical protein